MEQAAPSFAAAARKRDGTRSRVGEAFVALGVQHSLPDILGCRFCKIGDFETAIATHAAAFSFMRSDHLLGTGSSNFRHRIPPTEFLVRANGVDRDDFLPLGDGQ